MSSSTQIALFLSLFLDNFLQLIVKDTDCAKTVLKARFRKSQLSVCHSNVNKPAAAPRGWQCRLIQGEKKI